MGYLLGFLVHIFAWGAIVLIYQLSGWDLPPISHTLAIAIPVTMATIIAGSIVNK